MMKLIEGACLLETSTLVFPAVQVLSIQKLSTSHENERYRLVVSDGEMCHSALFAIHLNQLIQSQEVSALCVIKMKDFVLTTEQPEGTKQVISFSFIISQINLFLLFF